jgi:RNA polymerase sigma factor (sigma-70 family)
MLETLNILSALIINGTMEMTLEEIAGAYGEDLNPSLLAAAFAKTYKLIINVSNHYYGLTQDDIASFSLEKLDFCLQTYDGDRAAFSTYFTTNLMNKFREETQYLSTQKRKVMFYSMSYDVMVENGFDLESPVQGSETVDDLASYGLTEKEMVYCNLILKDFTNAEISKLLGVSVMTLSNMRKKLREKLVPLALEY